MEELLTATKAKHQEELEKEVQTVKEQSEQARLRVSYYFFLLFPAASAISRVTGIENVRKLGCIDYRTL